ncbi:hypothetical protein HYH03_006953 [Edaphochlamys debaryana]|uniref:Inositol polyphosphate-related phosphatase domain-containing protein n=1 Tax=Edaphochlamys debaryana TaxID=47281 RepID=A0A835Y6E0_9CHLO|nr:hypothetical protein HYH03_006953 [Edaphochlamys debaryana]|eukprot:KAG2495021.1 hypothetical protein HYH03_006953 [Edaphochlamys debaryana]
MKKLLGKVAAFADEVASYNDPSRNPALNRPAVAAAVPTTGPGGAGAGPLDPVLEHLLRNVRSRHVRQHFAKAPPAEYTHLRDMNIQVATFNVGGKKPPPGLKLGDWLGPGAAAAMGGGGGGAAGPKVKWPPGAAAAEAAAAAAANPGGPPPFCPPGPDMVAVAFEELVPLNAGSVMGVWATDNVDAWDRCLAAHLNGEEWAAQRYGPSGPPAPGVAAANAAALLDAKWQGGAAAGAAVALLGGEEEGWTYVQVASKQLVGVYLSVWVRRALLHAVHGVQVTTVATGFGGYLGNKGAVAARLRLFDSSLVLVACHLTAGEAEGDEAKRNADVADILRRAAFASAPDGGGAVPMTAPAAALVSSSLGPGHWAPGPQLIQEHDLVIWMGDLNYRLITAPPSLPPGPGGPAPGPGPGPGGSPAGFLPDPEVRMALRAGRLDALLAVDQLNRERAAGRVFRGFQEGRIAFPPTYKYKVGTNIYNGDDAAGVDGDDDDGGTPMAGDKADPEKHKRRTPAWCDRVLFWRRPCAHPEAGAALHQLGYWRGELTCSDHRPVAAGFVARVLSYDRRRIGALLESALRAVDMMQESMRPRVTVEPPLLEAGDWVALGRPVPLRLALANGGGVEALLHFVPPPQPISKGGGKFGFDDETPALPAWLSARPAEAVLPPGQSLGMELTVLVEGGPEGGAAALAAAAAASGPGGFSAPLDSIVILRVEDSADKFVSIGGRFLRSFVGLPLEALQGLGPTPALPPAEAQTLAEKLGLGPLALGAPASPAGSLPKELAALAAALAADGGAALRTPGILVDSAPAVAARAGPSAAAPAPGGPPADEDDAAGAMQPVSRAGQRAMVLALERLRLHLDAGCAVPAGTPPHDVAALLLLWAGQLPAPLIPSTAADAAAAAAPVLPGDAAALLRTHCAPAAAAAIAALLRALRAALEPEAVAANGLTVGRLAAAVGAWWLPPLQPGAAADAAVNRRAFVAMLLDPAAEEGLQGL